MPVAPKGGPKPGGGAMTRLVGSGVGLPEREGKPGKLPLPALLAWLAKLDGLPPPPLPLPPASAAPERSVPRRMNSGSLSLSRTGEPTSCCCCCCCHDAELPSGGCIGIGRLLEGLAQCDKLALVATLWVLSQGSSRLDSLLSRPLPGQPAAAAAAAASALAGMLKGVRFTEPLARGLPVLPALLGWPPPRAGLELALPATAAAIAAAAAACCRCRR